MPNFVLERDYLQRGNVPRALQHAYEVIWALRRGEIDWAMRREEIELACQVLCDADGGSPPFAYNTVMLIQPDLRRPERWEDDDQTSRGVRKACDLVIMAEVAHRCERYRQAVIWSEVGLGVLEDCASHRGDQTSLLRMVASSKRNPIAAAASAIVGIWPASTRRTGLPQQVKDDHYRRMDPLVSALIASGQTYSRTHAFGSQSLFLEAERLRTEADPEDWRRSRLADLREISEQTRGTSKRSVATAPLVEMEYLRVLGDVAGAREQAALAEAGLFEFGLPRHLARMAKYRYFSF